MIGCAGVAEASVILGEGIAGVKLYETTGQVRPVLGTPDHQASGTVGSDHVQTWEYYQDHKPASLKFTTISFVNGRVHTILTNEPSQKTSSGVGPGATVAAIEHGVPGVRCHTKPVPYCIVYSRFLGQRTYTQFTLQGNPARAASVDVAATP